MYMDLSWYLAPDTSPRSPFYKEASPGSALRNLIRKFNFNKMNLTRGKKFLRRSENGVASQ